MGNDGGSIPTRRELVKEAAKNKSTTELKQSQHEQQEYHWTTDPVSQKPLAQPVVSDCNGKLYNKITILEYLVEGGAKIESVASQKDIVHVKFDGDESSDSWKCPITGDKLGPGSKAIYIVPCGHAFSGHAIKEVSSDKCPTCDAEYAPNDLIPILPTTESDIARLSLRMKELSEKGLTHCLKKASGSKKRKNRAEDGDVKESKKSDAINDVTTASLTAQVLREQGNKKTKVEGIFSDKSKRDTNGDFMTRGFSIPNGKK